MTTVTEERGDYPQSEQADCIQDPLVHQSSAEASAVEEVGVESGQSHPRPNLLQQWEKNLARFPLARVAAGAVPRTVSWAIKTVTGDNAQLPGVDEISMSPGLMAQVAMDESLVPAAGRL